VRENLGFFSANLSVIESIIDASLKQCVQLVVMTSVSKSTNFLYYNC